MWRRQQQQDDKVLLLALAEESKSVLLDLSFILNQLYRNGGPPHATQQVLRRKNEAVNRLEQFITKQQRSREREERSNQEIYGNQQMNIERLEKQLQDQNTAFELERTRLQHQATVTLNAQAELDSSLNRVLPQLRGLLEVYDREKGRHAGLTQAVTITDQASNEELSRRLTELETEFDAERAHLLEQVSDAANAQWDISQKNLIEREAALTCPISLDVFEDPILTTCCGKTFSSEALTQALRQNHQCPVCRAYRFTTHANRDMASLVELYRAECSVLSSSAVTSLTIRSVVEERSDGSHGLIALPARENSNRGQQNQRVQATSEVSHHPSSRTTTHSGASITPSSAPSQVVVNVRGRRREGQNPSSRRRHSSRSSDSSTQTASSQAPHRVVSRNDSLPSSTASTTQASVAQSSPIARANNALQSTLANTVPRAGVGYRGGNFAQDLRPTTPPAVDPLYTRRASLYATPPQSNNSLYYANFGYYNSDSDY